MTPTLHALVLVQMAGWMIFGLVMLHAGWDPDDANRAPAWPWGYVVLSFFWALLLLLALIVGAIHLAVELHDRREWRRRR